MYGSAATPAVAGGYIEIYNNSGGSYIQLNGQTGFITSSSDQTLKKEIVDLTHGLATVQQLHPVSYTFIADESSAKQ
jgi:hypothetical protein